MFVCLAPHALHRVYNVGRWSTFTEDFINGCIVSPRIRVCKRSTLHRVKIFFPTCAHFGLRLSSPLPSAFVLPFLYAGRRTEKAILLLVTRPSRLRNRLRPIPCTSLLISKRSLNMDWYHIRWTGNSNRYALVHLHAKAVEAEMYKRNSQKGTNLITPN
jgi:hypothetical protein